MRSRAELMREQAKLLDLLPEVRERLHHIPAITNIGIGAKEVRGKTTDDFAFRLYVSMKLPREDVASHWRIPYHIQGVPTDVIPAGSTETIVDTRKVRPLRGGTSVKNEFVQAGERTLAGTLGCLVKAVADLRVMALTCQHVMTAGQASLGVNVGQPKYVVSCCCCTYNAIGTLFRATKNDRIDCAVVQLDDDIANEIESADGVNAIEEIGTLTGAAQAVCFETVTKRGINTGLTTGRVIDVLFEGSQILIEPAAPTAPSTFADLGDSGSVIVNSVKQVIGLLWAVDAATRTRGVANHIGPVMRDLQIVIAGQADAGLDIPATGCP
ncbi:MAG: hypothetical protein NTNFB02_22880 [Nitrospira sp.]